ncbi:MAG TPA: DUF1999 family protein [Trueperaceae bacterium]|nr:DUF1999 family protein [Trueperaceae bacterium]HRQ10749.1 DUF1999 family protein [Trueperaceae bacterium]
MSIRVRPLLEADLEPLAVIDTAYAAAHSLPPAVSLATLRFFERSGHSFVAERVDDDGLARPTGYLLAQAIWTGDSPTVHALRLAVDDVAAAEARVALVRALVKSAYDAGVYQLLFRTPGTDESLRDALQAEGYLPDDHVTLELVLGSRASEWAERLRAR